MQFLLSIASSTQRTMLLFASGSDQYHCFVFRFAWITLSSSVVVLEAGVSYNLPQSPSGFGGSNIWIQIDSRSVSCLEGMCCF